MSGPPPHPRPSNLWEASLQMKFLELLARPKRRGVEAVVGRPKVYIYTPRLLPSKTSLLRPPPLPQKGLKCISHTQTQGQNKVWRLRGNNNGASLGKLRRSPSNISWKVSQLLRTSYSQQRQSILGIVSILSSHFPRPCLKSLSKLPVCGYLHKLNVSTVSHRHLVQTKYHMLAQSTMLHV